MRDAVDDDLTGVRPLDAGDDLDQGGLAATVLAGEAVHLAGTEVERDAVQGGDAAVGLDDVTCLEHRRRVQCARRCHRNAFRAGPPSQRSRHLTYGADSEVVLGHGFGVGLQRGVADVDVVVAVELGQLLVAGDVQVGARLDRLALREHQGDLQLRLAGQRRIPEEDLVDRAVGEVLGRRRRDRRAHHADLVLQAGLLHGAGDARHVVARRPLEALDVRVLRQDLLGLLVGGLLVVGALDRVLDAGHAGELGDLHVVRGADPLHVGLRGQATDELNVLALLAHALREVLHDLPAVGGVVEGLDVDVGVLDAGRLVRDDLDALARGPGRGRSPAPPASSAPR